jgi:PilZ domain
MSSPVRKAKARPYSRRSRRFPLRVPIMVYGRTPDGVPFRDRTHTLNVDAYGARISVAATLEKGQSILVVNSFTQEERECRVVHVGNKHGGRIKVGVEFANPKGNFWHIYSIQVESKLQPVSVV